MSKRAVFEASGGLVVYAVGLAHQLPPEPPESLAAALTAAGVAEGAGTATTGAARRQSASDTSSATF